VITFGKPAITIDGVKWNTCNKGSVTFCMCPCSRQRSIRMFLTKPSREAIKKAYKERLFVDPFAFEDSECFENNHHIKCLTLRRIFK